jgi:hypothetical protein
MPIADIHGNPLQHYTDFPNDPVNSIEFGAGKNHYGKKEYPNCYLTDLSMPDLLHFTQYVNYEIEDCHYLDANCDFYEYNFEVKFENIILCNPFNYGYYGLGSAKRFFDRAAELLSEEGRIHILGSSSNKWCCKDSLDEYLKNDIEIFKPNHTFIMVEHEILTRQHQINTTYNFYRTELKDRTIPNERLVIKKV